MAKKNSTYRPKKRLSIKQIETVKDNLNKKIEELVDRGATKGLVISHMGYNIVVEVDHSLVVCDWRQNIGNICAGDYVLLTEDDRLAKTATIEAILPRKNTIDKQSSSHKLAKPFAANIDQLLVVVAHQPPFQPSLLDRYLITSEVLNIPCLVYFNKIDLLSKDSEKEVEEYKTIYQSIPNITWLFGSLKTRIGIDTLKKYLNHKRTVISGQSGVGKSTLINILIPDAGIQTKSISQVSGLGRHSTTNSTLYHLKEGGELIDTPGVRSFNTYHYSLNDIVKGYAEISPFIGSCEFSNCSHTHEKNCAILGAVKEYKISKLRYKQFIQALSEIEI